MLRKSDAAKLRVTDKLIERNDGRKFVTTLQVNVEQRGVEVRAGHRQVATYRTDAGSQGESHPSTSTSAVARYGKCRRHEQGATPQHMDQRGRQHPLHQQMEQCELYRPTESRLRGGQSREAGERDRQAGLPCHDVHQVQPGKGTPVPLRHQSRQRAAGRPKQREPHAGGREQRGQDQRGDQEPE